MAEQKMIVGVTEIGRIIGNSEATVMDLILRGGMPANLNKAGVYEISKAALDAWQAGETEEDAESEDAKKPAKAKSNVKK